MSNWLATVSLFLAILWYGTISGTAAAASGTTEIIDNTEQNLVAFRREVYLTIQSSLDFQEAAHKLLKMRVPKEMEVTDICLLSFQFFLAGGSVVNSRFCLLWSFSVN